MTLQARPKFSVQHLAERDELSRLLSQAATLEQALMCQYLFAAYSMKREHAEGGLTYAQLESMRRWQAQLLPVARQEMEHLGLVLNLCTALGESPRLSLPAFPFVLDVANIPMHHSLLPFGIAAMTRFAEFEMPDNLPRDSKYYRFLEAQVNDFDPSHCDAVARIYKLIRERVASLPEPLLFVAPESAQVSTHDIFPGAISGLDISRASAYGVKMVPVTNRATALDVIDQITSEGEGAQHDGKEGSHFATVMSILMELTDEQHQAPGFTPARPVVSNPCRAVNADVNRQAGVTLIEHPFTDRVLALFESCYTTLLMSLERFFAFPEDDVDEMTALQQASFYPMMTTIMRPLCEILSLLPADTSTSYTAGPSFLSTDPMALAPHAQSARHVLRRRYGEMQLLVEELENAIDAAGLDAELSETLKSRFNLMKGQISRSRMSLELDYTKPSRRI